MVATCNGRVFVGPLKVMRPFTPPLPLAPLPRIIPRQFVNLSGCQLGQEAAGVFGPNAD